MKTDPKIIDVKIVKNWNWVKLCFWDGYYNFRNWWRLLTFGQQYFWVIGIAMILIAAFEIGHGLVNAVILLLIGVLNIIAAEINRFLKP